MLIDTQIVVWSSFHPGRISMRAASAIRQAWDSGNELFIASTTLWEIAMAVTRKKIFLPHSLGTYLQEMEQRFRVLPIDGRVAERSMSFSIHFPEDPGDRLIAATALVHGLPLVTSDKKIRRSGEVPCIW